MTLYLKELRTWYLNGKSGIKLAFWKHVPIGTVVSIPWPNIDDPNEIWLPWLTANAGPQKIKWEWWLHSDINTVKIRFLNKNVAAEFALRFG